MPDISGMMGGMASGASGILTTIVYVLIGVFSSVGLVLLALWRLKISKFKHPCFIIKDTGTGKVIFEETKCGKFRKNKLLFNLVDWSGEVEMLVKDGYRKIQEYSGSDMHIINGRMGYVVEEKPDDPSVLVPINLSRVANHEVIMRIAPSSYRGVSTDLKHKGEKELLNPMLQYLPYITIGIVGVLCFLMFVITFQFVTGTLSMLADKCGTAAPAVVQAATTVASTAP